MWKKQLRNRVFTVNPMKIINSQSQMNASKCRKSKSEIQVEEDAINRVENKNIVGDLMWPIILFLKFFGHSPLSYLPTNLKTSRKLPETEDGLKRNQLRKYGFCWKSLFLVWSLFYAIWTTCNWTGIVFGFLTAGRTLRESPLETAYKHQGEIGKPFPNYVLPIITGIRSIIPMIQILQIFLTWVESKSLALFLNDWTLLQKAFQSTFPRHSIHNKGKSFKKLERSRNLLVFLYAIVPSAFFVPFFALSSGKTLLTIINILPVALDVSAVTLMEDVKVIMIYKTLAEAFSEIREGILGSIKLEKLTPSKVKSWRKLVHSVRIQVDQAGELQKRIQLLLIGGSIILITAEVFLMLHGPVDTSLNSWLLSAIGLGFLVLNIGRLYLKILAANSITQEEGLIARDIYQMDTNKYDFRLESEIKCLHDLITHKPSVISFGSYVSLNKRLLLSIASQVATYLIVLMQFTDED